MNPKSRIIGDSLLSDYKKGTPIIPLLFSCNSFYLFKRKMSIYSNVTIKHLKTKQEQADALQVRIAVFVDEQKYSIEDELDR